MTTTERLAKWRESHPERAQVLRRLVRRMMHVPFSVPADATLTVIEDDVLMAVYGLTPDAEPVPTATVTVP